MVSEQVIARSENASAIAQVYSSKITGVQDNEKDKLTWAQVVRLSCNKANAKSPTCTKTTRCNHCKRQGHTRANCWVLNPYLRPYQKREEKGSNLLYSNGLGKTHNLHVLLANPPYKNHKKNIESGIRNHYGLNISPKQISKNINDSYKCTTLGGKMINFTKTYDGSEWILDFGATDHMTGNKNLLGNYQSLFGNQFVTVANGEK